MFRIIRESLNTLRTSYRQYLVFGAIFLTLSSFVFVPLISWFFNLILRLTGSGYLLNGELARLVLDWRSLVLTALLFLLIFFVLFIEYATILVISHEAWSGRKVNISDAFFTAVKCIPGLFNFGLIHLLLLLTLLVPISSGPLAEWFFRGVNLPLLLDSQIQRSSLFLLLFIPVAILVIYVSLRSIFTLHYIVLARESTHQALAHSFALTRKRELKTILNLVLFNLLTVAAAFALLNLLNRLPGLLELRFSIGLLENIMVLISSYLTFIGVLMLVPLNMILVTRLFYAYQGDSSPSGDEFFEAAHSSFLNRFESAARKYFRGRKLQANLLLAAGLAITFAFNYAVYQQAGYLRWNVMVISHRADYSSAPENSLSGIDSALEKAVDLVEIDVQLSRDEIPVLHHDLNLFRMAGRRERVADLSWQELQQIDIGTAYSPEFAGESIPSLESALLAVKGRGTLLLDLKPDERWQLLALRTVELIEKYDMADDVYIQSFHHQILGEIRYLNPDIPIGQILTWAAGNLEDLDVDFFSINKSMLSDDFIQSARKYDRQVIVWTVNEGKNMRRVLTYDIDGIITHYPELLQSMINWPVLEAADEEAQDNIGAEYGQEESYD